MPSHSENLFVIRRDAHTLTDTFGRSQVSLAAFIFIEKQNKLRTEQLTATVLINYYYSINKIAHKSNG